MKAGVNSPIVTAPLQSKLWSLPEGVRLEEPEGMSPGITYPLGFLAAGVSAGLKESGRPDVGILTCAPELRSDITSAAVFTTNAFAAAPVIVTQRETQISRLSALVVNSGSANACTGQQGLELARAMQSECAAQLGLVPERVGVASTGLIGSLPRLDLLRRGIGRAAASLSAEGGTSFLECIMTTDRFPKACAVDVETVDGLVRIGACAKGAGMIAPAMATMLCFVTTDARMSGQVARSLLTRAVGRTFNQITVDGQMSTNDCVFLMANGASGVTLSPRGAGQLARGLRSVLHRLALMMVADGEGATKVIRLRVRGAHTDEQARMVARAVADSPLVKTAMYGCDPNWGRILSAAGAVLPGLSFPRAQLEIGGIRVVHRAQAVALGEEEIKALHAIMAETEIEVLLHLGVGRGQDEVYFSDLGHEYVRINSEYST